VRAPFRVLVMVAGNPLCFSESVYFHHLDPRLELIDHIPRHTSERTSSGFGEAHPVWHVSMYPVTGYSAK
jgi:hypothetical protein